LSPPATCSACGAPLPTGAAYCPRCATPVRPAAPDSAATPSAAAEVSGSRKSLDELIAERGPLPIEEALRIAYAVLGQLGAEHAQGRVHGAITPSSISVVDDQVSLAAPVPAAGAASMYQSPEQAQGAKLDARSDLYSMAAVLLGMTTARFAERTNAYAPPALELLPRWLVSVLMRALARDPRDRYPSAASLTDALRKGQASAATELVGIDAVLGRVAADRPPAAPERSPDSLPLEVAPVVSPSLDAATEPRPAFATRRRARPPLLPIIALVVLAAAAVFAWRTLTQPVLIVVNRLVLPVNVHVEGAGDWTIAPGATVERKLSRGRAIELRWDALRPMAGALPVGERLGGTTSFPNPLTHTRYAITAASSADRYFAPLITNSTAGPLRIIVNAGLAGAADCGCSVPAGARRMPIGYYRLFGNSTVQARDPAGLRATFRDVGSRVTDSAGSLGLRFNTGDFVPSPR
jgi:hypothetical protein